MTTTEVFRVRPLAEFVWPASFRYVMSAPWGLTQQELTVDVPEFVDDVEKTHALAVELWRRTIAIAISGDVQLMYVEVMLWRGLPIPGIVPVSNVYGLLGGTAAARDDTPCVVMHTGHEDSMARRRFFLPGVPSRWVNDGLLTHGAISALEAWGIGTFISMARHISTSPLLWLIAYPGLLPAGPGNVTGVAFRRVEHLRICWHTEKAPEPSSEPWP